MIVSSEPQGAGRKAHAFNATEGLKLNYLFGASAPAMLRVADRLLQSPPIDTADDAMQDTFVAFAHNATSGACACLDYRPVAELADDELPRYASRCRSYLLEILVNTCRLYYRNMKRQAMVQSQRVAMVGYCGDPAKAAQRAEFARLVRHALATLSEHLREVVVLKYYAHYSNNEIATILRIPEGTVKSRLHRARRSLRAVLCKNGVDGPAPEKETYADATRTPSPAARRRIDPQV